MKLRVSNGILGAAIAALGLAACGGGGSSSNPPTPPPCGIPGGTAQLLYPIPNATSVPANLQQIVFAVNTALPANTWNAFLSSSQSLNNVFAQTVATAAQISPSQVPSPAATPSFANPIYESITFVNQLPAATAISIFLNNLSSSCTPTGPIGTFTTQ
jgi:hypothetical protein